MARRGHEDVRMTEQTILGNAVYERRLTSAADDFVVRPAMDRPLPDPRRLALVAFSALLVGACSPDRGTAVANDITDAHHPLIAKVVYSGDDDDSGPWMDIVLRPGATREDARTVHCEVVKPAVERGSPPPKFGWDVLDAEGHTLASDLTPCA
jgi:hypothetical protein